MADWPLSPAVRQRQQQLEVRKQLQQINKIERDNAVAAERDQNIASFSAATFIRCDTKASSAAAGAGTPTAGSLGVSGRATPRGYSTVKYDMGYSNIDAAGESKLHAAALEDRAARGGDPLDTPSQRLEKARGHTLTNSAVAQAARRAEPHINPSSQITHGGRNLLGSPVGGADAATPTGSHIARQNHQYGASNANLASAGGGLLNASASHDTSLIARRLDTSASAPPPSQHSPSRSFAARQQRIRDTAVSATSKFNAFSSTLNAGKHSLANATLNNSAANLSAPNLSSNRRRGLTPAAANNNSKAPWQGHINAKIPAAKRPATTAQIDKAAAGANELLQKHLNDLIALKYRCEQCHDAMQKGYSVLLHDAAAADGVVRTLSDRYKAHCSLLEQWNALPALATESPSLRHQRERMAALAAADPHRGAFKDGMWTLNPLHNERPTESATRRGVSSRLGQAEAGASYAAAARGAMRGGAVLALNTSSSSAAGGTLAQSVTGGGSQSTVPLAADTAAFVGLNNTQKALQYAPVILREISFLRARIDKCRQLIADTASVSDKLQHMSTLIDAATNVDLACLGRLEVDAATIVVPASPAFPTLSLSDFDAVENEAASLTSYCIRAAAELRKAVQSAEASHSQCFEALVAAMRLGVKCAHAKLQECQRQINEIDRDTLLRVQRALDDCLQDEAACEERLGAVQRIIDLRSAALGSNVFGDRGGRDPIVEASAVEQAQLRARLEEIDGRKVRLIAEYDSLQRERAALEEIAASAAVSEQLVEEIRRHHV